MKQIIIISLVLFAVATQAQMISPTAKPKKIYKKPDNKGILYFEESSYGIEYKTNGWGFFYNKTKILHETKKKFWEIEFTKTKHEKEIKSESIFSQINTTIPKNYYFGKINSLYTFSYRKGYSYVLTQKSIRSGVEISLNVSYGIILGLLKPYELILASGAGANDSINLSTEKYSSNNADKFLNPTSIFGYAGFWNGFLGIKPVPGGTFKAGLAFDWNAFDDNISSLEVGFLLDGYLVNMPLMATAKNHQLFPAMYLSYRIGSKK